MFKFKKILTDLNALLLDNLRKMISRMGYSGPYVAQYACFSAQILNTVQCGQLPEVIQNV